MRQPGQPPQVDQASQSDACDRPLNRRAASHRIGDDLPKRAADLRPGLLVFFARPSLLQTWAEFFGHEWRHVGVTVQTDEGLRVASYCIKKCYRVDDPKEIMSAYNRVGIAHLFSTPQQAGEFQRFCRQFEFLERSDSPYSTSAILLGPLHLMARRCRPGARRSALFAIVEAYCRMQDWRYRDRSAYVCSTFAWASMSAVQSKPPRVPLSAHPDDEAAYATPATERDVLMARWLCGPTEIWQAIPEADRSELELTENSVEPTAVRNGSRTARRQERPRVGALHRTAALWKFVRASF